MRCLECFDTDGKAILSFAVPRFESCLSSLLVHAQQNLGLLLTLLGVAFGIANVLLFRCEMCRSPY